MGSQRLPLQPRYLKLRPHIRIFSEQCFRTTDPRALRQKELAELRAEERRAVRARIKIEKQAAVIGQESRSDVIDEKFPIRGRPFNSVSHFSDSVKTNPVLGHKIEHLMKIW